ncbi:MAG TPA: exopolysaccharide biosynthesis protein [Falsiroseomonas sp.]|nr:exopolysaccharide biosynthesis protein [Falsiroseomonas sp.]
MGRACGQKGHACREREERTIEGLREAPTASHADAHAIPVSELVCGIARSWPRERLTLGELIEALGPRGYGVLIVLFALPNLLPVYIPGLSPIFGFPLMIICAQLACGLPSPRLPAVLTRRTMRRSDLLMITEKALPWLRRVERWVKPRPSVVTSPLGERLVGAWGVLLCMVVVVPLPLTNGPPSLACLIMAIGLMEEDSLTIVGGALFGIAAAIFGLSIIGSVGWMLMAGFNWLFGLP